jgi:hypothetical protein
MAGPSDVIIAFGRAIALPRACRRPNLGGSMKQPLMTGIACSIAIAFILTGCATQPAPGISGRWRPVNRFAVAPEEIPLHPVYEFYASPLDRTLKAMLTRWAVDSQMALAYEDPSDFTLYEPVSKIRTSDLRKAVAALSSLYALEHIVVAVDDNRIVVRPASAPTGHDVAAATMPAPASVSQR